jgi:hypothetical protein
MKPKSREHATHVIIGGESLFYDAKAPYEKSGMSIKGALEYDPENDLVKCHECGEFFKSIVPHAWRVHGTSAREYKIRHGLSVTSALVCESTRRSYIAGGLTGLRRDPHRWARITAKAGRARRGKRSNYPHRTAEYDSSRQLCNLQIIDRLGKATKQLGRAPSIAEMMEFGLEATTIRAHFGSVRRLFKLAGIQGRDGYRWKSGVLLAFIKNFIDIHHREPGYSDCRRRLIPSGATYHYRFGNLRKAVALARKRKFRPGDLPPQTRIRPVQAAKMKARHGQRFWGVNIGRFAIGGQR